MQIITIQIDQPNKSVKEVKMRGYSAKYREPYFKTKTHSEFYDSYKKNSNNKRNFLTVQ